MKKLLIIHGAAAAAGQPWPWPDGTIQASVRHLGSSDLAIMAARRMLLKSIQDVQEGRDPIGPFADSSRVRPAEMVLPEAVNWQEALQEELVAKV